MLRLLGVRLPSLIPIVGRELSPHVLVSRPDDRITSDDIPETAPADGFHLRHRWYRIQDADPPAKCIVHPLKPATVQCVLCMSIEAFAMSYHCSAECFCNSWSQHRMLHLWAAKSRQRHGSEAEENFTNFAADVFVDAALLNNGCTPVLVAERGGGGQVWYEVGWKRAYIPSTDDLGHKLQFECTVVNSTTRESVSVYDLRTERVIPSPLPAPRRMIPLNSVGESSSLDRTTAAGKFTILSYNVLADFNAEEVDSRFCPPLAISWTYRRQNLLREIVGYRADILCLQEVQSDHFDNFFAPELEKHGYTAIYKKRTAEASTDNYANDGCATFFRRDCFSLVKKYEMEFSKAAKCLREDCIPPAQRMAASTHFLRDNVVLVVVLQTCDSVRGADGSGQLLCVANTHLRAHPDYKDVKLWQVQILLKGLQYLAKDVDIPMLVCGDFDSIPGSGVHVFITTGAVDPLHPDLANDPYGVLGKLYHQLPLVSAYSDFSRLEQQRRHMDVITKEPLFTYCSREFMGTLDYIFFTDDLLTVESLLELLDKESMKRNTADLLQHWGSNHIALAAQFCCKPRWCGLLPSDLLL